MYTKKILFFATFLFLTSKAYVQVQECTLYEIPSDYLGDQSIEEVSADWASSGTDIFPLSIPPESRDVFATGGNPFNEEADLLLHGSTGDAQIGPKCNRL